jgi:membrane protein
LPGGPNFLVRGGRAILPTLRYLMETEVHVFAFSVSAGMLLSFFPFVTVMLSLCRYVFKWKAAVNAIYFTLDDYFPDAFGHFLRRNFEATVESRGPVQIVSLLLLFFTASGIFEPLEVALNRIWNCTTNRSYLKNQLIGLALALACGALVLVSVIFTAMNAQFLRGRQLVFRLAAIPMSVLLLFLIYWVLPNCKVKAAKVLPAAILVGCLLEILKYVNLLTWPYLRDKLALEYGPFVYTVSIILWGFVAALVVLAGAEWSARYAKADSAQSV